MWTGKVPSGDNPAKKGDLGREPRQFSLIRKGRRRRTDRHTQRKLDKDRDEETETKNKKEGKRNFKEQGPGHRPEPEEVGLPV